MPAHWFKCPDGVTIEISKCLEDNGCRMKKRCGTRPFLRLVSYDRTWDGVSPSSAGNGPRLLYLRATVQYVISPNDRVWAAFGTSTHEKLSMHAYSHNVLTETKLKDVDMKGAADVLEEDEGREGFYVLTDYKNFGSYKAAKSLGIVTKVEEETILDKEGKPIILKTGKNKGSPKTRQKRIMELDPYTVDLKAEELQLNRYRIFFESYGFPISHMQLQVMVRDGGTYVAKNRGIDRNLYVIPIRRLANKEVLDHYKILADETMKAFNDGYIRKCNMWESWERRRCDSFCEVVDACKKMSKNNNEKWGII